MNSYNVQRSEGKKDRKLGNEWDKWDGRVENTDATIGLFLLLSFFVMTIFSLVLLFGNYLVYPRLISLHPMLPFFLKLFILGFIVLSLSWIILLLLSLFFNINILMGLDKKLFNIFKLLPHATKLAKRVGISKDRVTNSLIKLNNRIVKLRKHLFCSSELLVLLPRCLKPEIMSKINEINIKYKLKSFILDGGEAAREKVKLFRPKAVVAVACERDLISGIKDVTPKILVYGIPNLRPNGPCKETVINLREFENAIRLFLGLRPVLG